MELELLDRRLAMRPAWGVGPDGPDRFKAWNRDRWSRSWETKVDINDVGYRNSCPAAGLIGPVLPHNGVHGLFVPFHIFDHLELHPGAVQVVIGTMRFEIDVALEIIR